MTEIIFHSTSNVPILTPLRLRYTVIRISMTSLLFHYAWPCVRTSHLPADRSDCMHIEILRTPVHSMSYPIQSNLTHAAHTLANIVSFLPEHDVATRVPRTLFASASALDGYWSYLIYRSGTSFRYNRYLAYAAHT